MWPIARSRRSRHPPPQPKEVEKVEEKVEGEEEVEDAEFSAWMNSIGDGYIPKSVFELCREEENCFINPTSSASLPRRVRPWGLGCLPYYLRPLPRIQEPDSPLYADAYDELEPQEWTRSIDHVRQEGLVIPARDGFGSSGRPYQINTNHFLVDLDLDHVDPHQYEVTITPDVPSKTKRRHIMESLISIYWYSHLDTILVAYDENTKSLFAAGPLPFDSKEFSVIIAEHDGRECEFFVTIKFADKNHLHYVKQFFRGSHLDLPQETVQTLDLVLRESASMRYAVVGRSFFSHEFGHGVPGDGIEFWRGFYQRLRPTQMGLSLNIDVSARAFYKQGLVSDFIGKFLDKDLSTPFTDQERIKVKRALRGVRVEVCHQNCRRHYKVQGLTVQPISQLTFPDEIGAVISVVQYFRDKYNIHICYPLLPAIQAGTDAKPIYLPTEICWLVGGQRYPLKLNRKQVTNLLKATCERPKNRENRILSTMWSNHYNALRIANMFFGMQVTEQLTTIDARILQPPTLLYRRKPEVTPHFGQWDLNDQTMFDGAFLDHWAVANFSRQQECAVMRFCFKIVKMCRSKGIAFNNKPLITMKSALPHDIKRILIDIQSQCETKLSEIWPPTHLELLIVILPEAEEAEGSYGIIKRVCETELGIVSQCCKPQHVMKPSKQYLENIAMKINVKLRGTNSILSASLNKSLPYVTDRPTIIFGADVAHPSPGEDSSPSIAAVVASVDWPFVTMYEALVSAQPHRQEIIQDLYNNKEGAGDGGLIRKHLLSFWKSSRRKPERIIYYRNGVSEGQFNEVLLNEMDSIRRACISLEENYLPPVTFIVVNKRHHTRFFPEKHDDKNTSDRSGNILPGTVVDTKICHPTEIDFYLCSHAGIKGTSRPTHYHVLYDENKFTADGLQMLTNSLCYTYVRCTRSLSIVPPARYAHLAASRARFYLEDDAVLSDSDSCATKGDRIAEVKPLPAIHDRVQCVMFYC